ncbi:MAG: TraR/DksA C4-type zinc finger protein [Patescibacteria group bacterium]
MDQKTLDILKKQLLAEKDSVIEELSLISKPDAGDHVVGDFNPQMPDYGDDTGDDPESSPAEVEDYQLNINATSKLEAKLNDINTVLEKIENNEYGICDVCGGSIAENRLQANPSALTCVKCSE